MKNTAAENVHLHQKTLVFLKKYLKRGYVDDAQDRLKSIGLQYTKQSIRNIKAGYVLNWEVLEILAEIANENKIAFENVKQIIGNN